MLNVPILGGEVEATVIEPVIGLTEIKNPRRGLPDESYPA
jgi:hypothetical protein